MVITIFSSWYSVNFGDPKVGAKKMCIDGHPMQCAWRLDASSLSSQYFCLARSRQFFSRWTGSYSSRLQARAAHNRPPPLAIGIFEGSRLPYCIYYHHDNLLQLVTK